MTFFSSSFGEINFCNFAISSMTSCVNRFGMSTWLLRAISTRRFKLWFFKPDYFVGNKWSAKFTGYNFNGLQYFWLYSSYPERPEFLQEEEPGALLLHHHSVYVNFLPYHHHWMWAFGYFHITHPNLFWNLFSQAFLISADSKSTTALFSVKCGPSFLTVIIAFCPLSFILKNEHKRRL